MPDTPEGARYLSIKQQKVKRAVAKLKSAKTNIALNTAPGDTAANADIDAAIAELQKIGVG